MFQTPTTRVWKQLHDDGKLTPAQDAFWKPKPPEELFDLQSDPDETVNLVGAPVVAEVLNRLRKAQQDLATKIRDVGFLPESELRSRFDGASPYDAARDGVYPFSRVFETADLAAQTSANDIVALRWVFKDDDSAVRYWAAMGLLIRGAEAVKQGRVELVAALKDKSPDVRVVAAEALARYGNADDQKAALELLVELASWEKHGNFVAVAALNALDAAGDKAKPFADAIKKLPTKGKVPDQRYAPYVPRLLEDLLAKWK